MKSHEAARVLVRSHRTLDSIKGVANESMKERINEVQDMITEVCDGLYPDIIDEIRRECADYTG